MNSAFSTGDSALASISSTVSKGLVGRDPTEVCVVVPVRNRPDLLRTCLRSLQEQDLPSGAYEILVCDDGSVANIAAAIAEFKDTLPRVSVLRQPPKGPAAARNMGFRSRDAEIFVCVDSDIVCHKGFLSSIVSELRAHADLVAAEATVLPTGEAGLLFDAPSGHGGSYPSGASAYRAEALRKVGGFDETFPFPACEDAEVAARLLRLGPYGYVPEAVVYHPTRRVTWRMQWRGRQYWRYVMILAKRYGFLAFPGHPAGPFPRLRVALAAVLTLPAGRFLGALKQAFRNPREALLACTSALFDVVCGLAALPEILFAPVPERKNYLGADGERVERAFP